MQEFEIIVLATGLVPTARQLIGWEAYQQSGGSVDSIAATFVASTMFADKYNNGSPVDPNSPITSSIASGIIGNALGTAPATNQVNAWVNTGLPLLMSSRPSHSATSSAQTPNRIPTSRAEGLTLFLSSFKSTD